ncbi:MAG: hypothetical protein CGU28_16495 [Candidatus Dactylopiibacterium carminicum]|uniref:Uncharacterized protein n=1 Tax=Candidatus Dactylopiibacterium carminicum TaxID=857335 RepID=A0A272EMT0_9RHOO|nr:hypothetical protein [Candidatus Dactylopiibacterium carminicum]KAF7597839.1 hypothetical protein BGI27_16590 [Candidatus Dactylopiibacterium carminicum]PAS91428.1 MAG: hypothetical protein CGU29_16540 [Candidatus Dactylopiibacterium carminicum]PAS92543.1 MAG: hypothetical protein CGU28_16495 [Candidatus Dactylopiibacterium carminicum]PAS95690.1 MAG: hypothetical protein BSR46_16620 [Candidatus Dactylopiibacterium carminicum]
MRKRPSRSSAKTRNSYARKAGLPPGSIVHIGDKPLDQASFSLFDYDGDGQREVHFSTLAASRQYSRQHRWIWLHVQGVHETAVMEE